MKYSVKLSFIRNITDELFNLYYYFLIITINFVILKLCTNCIKYFRYYCPPITLVKFNFYILFEGILIEFHYLLFSNKYHLVLNIYVTSCKYYKEIIIN